MIPRVSKPGRSFKGAVQYYAHDKGQATSDRLGFVELVNLPIIASEDRARDLERAGAIMAWTALHQDDLRRMHHHQTAPGTPYRSPSRKLEAPVYTFSLRFSPDDAHKVDAALLKTAAYGALKALGMESCQAVILEHKDSVPTHVHVVACLVDPKTGQTVSRSKDFYKLSTFAEKFSRQHGLKIVAEREENNARRRKGEIVKHQAVPRADWELMQGYRNKSQTKVERERAAQQEADKAQLASRQRYAIHLFKQHLVTTYGRDRQKIDRDMHNLQQRMSRPGLFAAATRFFDRVTGRDREIITTLHLMQKTRDAIDQRMADLRIPFARKLREERIRLANRHAAELIRDAQYFEARRRSRSESDSHADAIRRATFAQIARDHRQDGLANLLENQGVTLDIDLACDSLVLSNHAPAKEKKWSRATGRNPDRPRRRR